MGVKIQLRRDTASNLANKVLANGEPGYATDTSGLKIGDASTAFSALSPITISNTGMAGAGNVITNIVSISSGDYAALGSKHPSTVYLVTGT